MSYACLPCWFHRKRQNTGGGKRRLVVGAYREGMIRSTRYLTIRISPKAMTPQWGSSLLPWQELGEGKLLSGVSK